MGKVVSNLLPNKSSLHLRQETVRQNLRNIFGQDNVRCYINYICLKLEFPDNAVIFTVITFLLRCVYHEKAENCNTIESSDSHLHCFKSQRANV